LGPAEDCKGDTYSFWNPITKHVIELRSAICLQQTYVEYHKLDISQFAQQFESFTDELNETFDEDEDVTPVDNFSNQTAHLDNDDYNDQQKFERSS
jgi:hypothetical protein